MAIVVETGTGSSTSESYRSVADWKTWATARGHDYSAYDDTEIEQALRRGTSYLDFQYEARFTGSRTNLRSQALAYPRDGSYDAAGNSIASNAIPVEIANACNEATWRELVTPNTLLTDIDPGGGLIKREKVGPVETEYAVNGQTTKTFPAIGAALATLIGRSSPYSAVAVRA